MAFNTVEPETYYSIPQKVYLYCKTAMFLLLQWKPEINHFLTTQPIILVGTKTDLREELMEQENSNKTWISTEEVLKELI